MRKYSMWAANQLAENNPATKPKLGVKKCHIRAMEQLIVNNTLSFSKFSIEGDEWLLSVYTVCLSGEPA